MTSGPAMPQRRNGSPSAEEAAAIATAIERFMLETAPTGAQVDDPGPDEWTRAALLEGISREHRADVPHPWINT